MASLPSTSSTPMPVRGEGADRAGPMAPASPEAPSQGEIAKLAPETLARVFAYLDPRSLSQCAQTCRAWNAIVSLDTTWRAALMVSFGLEEREERIIAASAASGDPAWLALRTAPALRRMQPSWRGEYFARTALLRRWRKSRMPTVLTDPRISQIDMLALSASHRFVLSLSYGFSVASRSNAITGKVAKDFLDAQGLTTRSANGYPNVEHSPVTTSMATDATASRIVWGHRSGDISLTTIDWRGQNARGTVHNRAWPAGRAHAAPVTAIHVVPPPDRGGMHSEERYRQQLSQLGDMASTFATAAADGTVMVWHPKLSEPLWRGTAYTSSPDHPTPIGSHVVTHVEYAPCHGALVAARRDGALVVWQSIPWGRIVRDALEAARAHTTIEPATEGERRHIPALKAEQPLATMALDAMDDRLACLLHYTNDRVFFRVDIHGTDVHTTVFGAPRASPLTCLRCEWDVRSKPLPLPASIVARLRASRLQERKFVCAGTASGAVGVWEWDAEGEPWQAKEQALWQGTDAVPTARQVRPALVFDGHHHAITAIACTPALILIGCEDGMMKALDALAGHVVRVFHERAARRHPARMLAEGMLSEDDAARFRVHHIIAAHDMLVASIGRQVLSWRTHDEAAAPVDPKGAKAHRAKAGMSERGRMRADWDRVVQEEQQHMQYEREAAAATQAERAAMVQRVHGALDEDAALDYALMLSREDSAAASNMDDLSSDLMYGLDDLDLDVHDGDSDATPLSPSLPSRRTRDPWHTRSSAAGSPHDAYSQSWSKLRTIPRPTSHAEMRGVGSTSSSLSSCSPSMPQHSPLEWPVPTQASSSRPMARSPASLGAWATKSPTLRAVDAPASHSSTGRSALVAQTPRLPRAEKAATSQDDEMDDDLRLALALSLTEYEATQSDHSKK